MDTFLAFFCFLMRISRLYPDHHWSAALGHLVVGRFLRNGTVLRVFHLSEIWKPQQEDSHHHRRRSGICPEREKVQSDPADSVHIDWLVQPLSISRFVPIL